ncbi:MAG: Lrp/AsnC family transcriptional regulator [Candidatus Thermoplasmatota archaeon]|nr:Lrp/AsnC family transcriptional regulator [Candidatus Thermoplasmatota archaeon]
MENKYLDEIDIKILRTLQKDVRTPFKEIANQCNISTDTIKNRYNKMIENKVIRGSTIVIDPKKMGQGNLVIIGIKVVQQFSESVLNMIKKMNGLCVVTKSIGQYDIEAIFLLEDIEQIGITKDKIEDFPQVKSADAGIFVDKPLLCPKNFEFE